MATTDSFANGYRTRIGELILPDLTHLAVGNGVVVAPPAKTATGLVHELGRVQFTQRFFVTPDVNGSLTFDGVRYSPSSVPTRFIYFLFRFAAAEALGNWTELGVFGNGVAYTPQTATLVALAVAGDDKLDVDVILSGAWAHTKSTDITVKVTTGGGSGVAAISWTVPAGSGLVNGGPVAVTFGTPITLGASGVAIRFTGGLNGVLLINDTWRVIGTIAPTRPEYANGGIYDVNGNPAGQVLASGTLCRLSYLSPAQTKASVQLDVAMVLEVVLP